MKKSMMFPIHKKWVDMIFNGEKKFEFRNKLPKHLVKGMKIYWYETFGKRVCGDYLNGYIHEGQGMIVGEATVGEIYSDFAILRNIEEIVMVKTGWSNHFYAIELTNVIKYDFDWMMMNLDELPMGVSVKPIAKEEFIGWTKLFADTEGCISYPSFSFEENNFTKSEIDYYKLTHSPQAPIYVVEREVK